MSQQDAVKQVAIHVVAITVVVISSYSNTSERPNAQRQWEVNVCRKMTRLFPALLPNACVPRDQISEDDGGIVNIEINLNCGAAFVCTWMCMPKKYKGHSLRVKHGPWTLCEPCFGDDPVPKACYHDGSLRQTYGFSESPNQDLGTIPHPSVAGVLNISK